MPRKKQDRVQKHYRVAPTTPAKLSALALAMGYKYGDGGAVGEWLDAIADGSLLVKPIEKQNIDK